MSCNGEPVELSYDHKPSNAKERERIQAAGGTVSNGRLMGVLSVSRAFGDIEYKTRKNKSWPDATFTGDPLIAVPDIIDRKYTRETSSL